MDAAALGQNEQLAPAVLVFMLLLSVLRAAAARIQQPSPMRASASHGQPHAHQHTVRHAAPRPELPATPPRPTRRPHAAPAGEAAPPSAHANAPCPRSSEPRRRRGVPLLLRPVAWVVRFAFSPLGMLGAAGGAAFYLHQRPDVRVRLERAARTQVQRGEALVRGLGARLPRRPKRAPPPPDPAPVADGPEPVLGAPGGVGQAQPETK